jgi:hypothetical protein
MNRVETATITTLGVTAVAEKIKDHQISTKL